MKEKNKFILIASFLYIFFIFNVVNLYSQISLEWSKFSGDEHGKEEARSLCFDSQMNVYSAGKGITGSGADIYKVIKYHPDGTPEWERYYANGSANKIINNGSDTFFVAGSNGLLKLNNLGNVSLLRNGNVIDIKTGEDNYIYSLIGVPPGIITEKYNPDGSVVWTRSRQMSPYNYEPYRLFLGIDNKINITASYRYIVIGFLVTGNIFYSYDSIGNLIYDGGPFSGTVKEVRDDYSNNNFFVGYRDQSAWHSEILLYKVNSVNSVLDTAFYNGPGNGRDEPNDIVTDNQGNIYIACRSWGVAVDYDFVVLKYNTNGDLIWEYRFNGSENSYDSADKLKLDSDGNIFASGTTTLNSHGVQIYTVKLSPQGQVLWWDKFSRYNSPADSNSVKDLKLDNSGNIYLCGNSRNSVTQRYDFLTLKYSNKTSVINTGSIQEKNYYLLENYPNPFNPETKIRFNLPGKANVKIDIINSSGKRIAELVNENFSGGEHTVLWNAESFPSGIYFISFHSGDYKEIKKAVLIK